MSFHNTDFPAATAELNQIIVNRKIPNALLFTGNPGAGRKQAAFRFAKAVNCLSSPPLPCNTCRSCKKIDNRLHPDMILVNLMDNKKTITISQIREITALTAARPNEAAFRMVLISGAGQMNIQAQNALLKALEEPPERTFFILMARDTAALLPTIISRCRHLRFIPLTGKAMAAHLAESCRIDARSAWIAAATAGTDLDLALTLLNPATAQGAANPAAQEKPPSPGQSTGPEKPADAPSSGNSPLDWPTARPWLIQQLCRLISGSSAPNVETALTLSWFLSRHPDDTGPGLAVMRTFFRDLCVFRHAPKKIVNLDFSDTFQALDAVLSTRQPLAWMTELHETEKRLTSNSSTRMTLERFFLKIIPI
jgi:DNA polymerase III subunit delta'